MHSFYLAVREMKIHSTKAQWSGCVYEPILQIQINQNSQQCITSPKSYPIEKTIVWNTEDDLNNCAGNNIFDPKNLDMGIRIIPKDKNEYYCIGLIEVVLDDKQSTNYQKQPLSYLKKGDCNLEGFKIIK